MATNKRRQKMSTARKEYVHAMQELRRSNAATAIPSGKRYVRKRKHSKKEYE